MTVSTIKMTADQYKDLGEDPVGVRLELVNGEVAVSPSPTPRHSHVQVALTIVLGEHVRQHRLGRLYSDVDTIFGPYDVRRLDLLFFSTGRLHLIGEKSMEGPPDLCVEIISPSSQKIDKVDKFEQYALGGVRFYWIVDPLPQTVEAYELVAGSYQLSGAGRDDQVVRLPPFLDLAISLGELWPPER